MRPLIAVIHGNSVSSDSMCAREGRLHCNCTKTVHRVRSTGKLRSQRFLDLIVSFFLTLAIAAVVKIMPDGEGQFPGSYLRINHTHASAEVSRTPPS